MLVVSENYVWVELNSKAVLHSTFCLREERRHQQGGIRSTQAESVFRSLDVKACLSMAKTPCLFRIPRERQAQYQIER